MGGLRWLRCRLLDQCNRINWLSFIRYRDYRRHVVSCTLMYRISLLVMYVLLFMGFMVNIAYS
jgi:hypothetical protein